MKALLIALALTACSQISEYQEFEMEAKNRGCRYFPTGIYFTEILPDSSAGYCIPGVGVFLNENFWPTYGRYQKLELVFHEMGHCGFGYGHSDDGGIMSPTMHTEEEIELSWGVWVDQFFENCP